MRTGAFKRPATSGAVLLAALVAAATIGASGPALATCGSSSYQRTGVYSASTGSGLHTASAHPAASCPFATTSKTLGRVSTGLGDGHMFAPHNESRHMMRPNPPHSRETNIPVRRKT